jgi:hypothetical protein
MGNKLAPAIGANVALEEKFFYKSCKLKLLDRTLVGIILAA